MIYLFTGLPGASKTLNCIKYVNESVDFQNRPIFYNGINELKLPWTEISDNFAREWYTYPPASVVIIDECQRFFRPRPIHSALPLMVSELETHRHSGIDLILITQHPMIIDSAVRRFVGRHFHFQRIFGSSFVKRLRFEECVDNPSRVPKSVLCTVDQIRIDKTYFAKYKSAQLHTQRFSMPFKYWVILLFFLLLPVFFYYVYDRFSSSTSAVPAESVDAAPALASPPDLSHASDPASEVSQFPALASSADAVSVPRLSGCMRLHSGWTDICKCNDQQGVFLEVSALDCRMYVTRGVFDPLLTEEEIKEAQRAHLSKGGLVLVTGVDAGSYDRPQGLAGETH